MYTHGPTCLQGPVARRRLNGQPPSASPAPPPIRRHLVERVRREIAAGSYDTPEKLEAALRRLFARLDDE